MILLYLYIIFAIPTVIVAHMAISYPVYKAIRHRFPSHFIAKNKYSYFTVCGAISALTAPFVFAWIFIGNIEYNKFKLFSTLIKHR